MTRKLKKTTGTVESPAVPAKPAHSERGHALLSASKAERWLHCTPSARLEEDWVKKHGDQSSIYADEGTLAHEMAEVLLRAKHGFISPDQAKLSIEALRANPLYDPEMYEYVETYVNYVANRVVEAKEKEWMLDKDVINIEVPIDFSSVVPEGYGTADAIIFDGTTIEVIDLKYGKGVKVNADGNAQLRLYALGVLYKYELSYDITNVRMTIVQPRLDHIDSVALPAEDIYKWAETEVKALAQKAYKGEGDLTPGDHCKFCKIKPVCKAIADQALNVAKQDFKPEDPACLLTDDELVELSQSFPLIEDWIKSARDYMLNRALQGKAWPGMKLVESNTRRKWVDEEGAKVKLKSEGYAEDEFVVTKLKGISDIEKLVGKKEFTDLLGSFIEKPKGEPVLADMSDKRQAYSPSGAMNSALLDFDDLMQ
jgi:hypothetical protein